MKETDKGYQEWLELRQDVGNLRTALSVAVGALLVGTLVVGVLELIREGDIEGRIEKLEAAAKAAVRPSYPACPRPGCLSGHSPDAGFHVFEPGTATTFERDSYHRSEARQVVVNQDATVEFTSNEASTIVTLDGEKINVRRINH